MTGLPLENCKALLRDLTDRHYPWAVVTDNTINRYTPYADFPTTTRAITWKPSSARSPSKI